MPEQYEAIVRLVHAAHNASFGHLLNAYRARPLSPSGLRRILDLLVGQGWLICVRDRSARRSNLLAWQIAEEAVPHLLDSPRLPVLPDQRAASGASRVDAGSASAPTPPTYRVDYRTPWVPQTAAPVRAGALDFLRCPSRTAFSNSSQR